VATRALERGGLERHLVARAEVLATDATGVLARTAAYRDPWPQGPFPPPPDRSRPREGRLRIEAVADTVLRARYAPGPEVLEFSDDPATWRIGDQFLCGRSILAAPLFEPGGRRRAYPPAGTWTDWWTRERVSGPGWVEAEHGLDTMPLWLREGAVVPMGPVVRWVGERPTDPLTVVVAPSQEAGRAELEVPVDGREVTIRYEARPGRHLVQVEGHAGEVVLDAPASVELRR
jgi:hypothetical protein